MKILLASSNPGKIKEINKLISNLDIELISQDSLSIPPADESGLSFIENALLKARHGAQESQLPCIAEDSGLCVDALQGAPGIYSARYAGLDLSAADHIHKLLKTLESIPDEKRQAYYICTIALVRHAMDPDPIICQAKWHGSIIRHPQGDKGFGYDPIFFISNFQCTAAELNAEQKNKVSHRAQAFALLIPHLKNLHSSIIKNKTESV